jgi:hypothetical protein
MKDGFTPLFSPLLQKVVRNYRKYLDYFIETGVIEKDGEYRSSFSYPGNEKSYGYRFTAKYRSSLLLDSHMEPSLPFT